MQPVDDLEQLLVGVEHRQGSRAGPEMAAAAEVGHQLADRGAAATVEDRMADVDHHRVLAVVELRPHRDVRFREERVDQEAVADERIGHPAKVGEDHVAREPRALHQLPAELLVQLEHVDDPLAHLGLDQDLLDGALLHPVEQAQEITFVVRMPGARVDREAEQHPALGLQHVAFGQLGRVEAVGLLDHRLVALLAAEILPTSSAALGASR